MSRWKIFGIDNKVHLLQLLITCLVFFLVCRPRSLVFAHLRKSWKRAQEYFAAQYNGAPPRLFELFEYFGYGSTGGRPVHPVGGRCDVLRADSREFVLHSSMMTGGDDDGDHLSARVW